jgi:uncharacterized MAPEG superfamily protein
MTIEFTLLAWTLVLAIVQIALTAIFRTLETGIPYNAGPRDVPSAVPVGKITGRLMRAQANLFETLPVFIGAVIIAHLGQIHTTATIWGATLYFLGRIAYVPLYAFGIPYIRTVVWTGSLVGIIMVLESSLI